MSPRITFNGNNRCVLLKINILCIRAVGCLAYYIKNLLCLSDILIPVVIQWLLYTLLVAICIGKYYSKII